MLKEVLHVERAEHRTDRAVLPMETEEHLVRLLKRQNNRLEQVRQEMAKRRMAFEDRRKTCHGMNARLGISSICCPECEEISSSTTQD